jgi:NAD(P)-dependent dehydrogenase (short-subunit alcohol dehydrogenase family)
MTIDGQAFEQGSVFSGRNAIVVGGSGGIGAELSLELSRRGAFVTIQGRNEKKVEAILKKIDKAGGSAKGIVQNIESIAEIAESLVSVGRVDILIVAFGPFLQKPFAEHTIRDWEKMALLNLALPGALASMYFAPMCASKFGRMLFFGGTRTDQIRGYLSNAAYAAAKTSMGVLAKSIALEGAAHNVSAVVVCPGFVKTEYLDPAWACSLAAKAPQGKLQDAASISKTALDLLDADPCIASGAVVSLDGGLTL